MQFPNCPAVIERRYWSRLSGPVFCSFLDPRLSAANPLIRGCSSAHAPAQVGSKSAVYPGVFRCLDKTAPPLKFRRPRNSPKVTHGTSVCTPEAGEQQKRSISRKSDGTSPPRTKQGASRAPRPQTQAKLASLFSAMAKHNEDSPRYTPPVDPAAVPVEIGVCRLELSRHVCLELSWHVYTHNTHMRACCTTSGLPRNSQSARQLRYTQIRGSVDLQRI